MMPGDEQDEIGAPEMSRTIILCGNTCKHNHDSPNGPTGCCSVHGPYMYFCHQCSLDRALKDNRDKAGSVPLSEQVEGNLDGAVPEREVRAPDQEHE